MELDNLEPKEKELPFQTRLFLDEALSILDDIEEPDENDDFLTYSLHRNHTQNPNHFTESPTSNVLLSFFSMKYCPKVALIGLLKILSTISPFVNKNLPNLNSVLVGASGSFKTRTSKEAQTILPNSKWIKMRDDDTLNAFLERYKQGLSSEIGQKTVFLDNATTLFETKPRRIKDRLISGLSNLLTEGEWTYGERLNPNLVLKGKISFVMNLTFEAYNKYESKLLGSTFLERFLTLFLTIPKEEMDLFLTEREKRETLVWRGTLQLRLKPFEVENLDEHKQKLMSYAERFSALSLKNLNRCYDQIVALLKSHLALNGRTRLVGDDFCLLEKVEPYLVNPFASYDHKIIGLHNLGYNVKKICSILNRSYDSYKPYVYRVLKQAKERGIIEVKAE